MKAIKIIVVFLISVNLNQIKAQNSYVDSLLYQVKTDNDSLKVVHLNKIASSYAISSIDTALFYSKKAFQIARKNNNSWLMGACYSSIAKIYYKNNQYEKTLKYRQLSLQERLKSTDTFLIGNTYIDIGGVYVELSEYKNAIDNHLKALDIFKQINNQERIAVCLVNVGNVYSYQRDFANAIEYYQSAISYIDTTQNSKVTSTIYNNLGALYYEQKDIETSMLYLLKSLAIREQLGDKHDIAMAYGNLGSIYGELKDFEKAYDYLNKAASINLQLNDFPSLTGNYLSIAQTNIKNNKIEDGIKMAEKAREIAEKLDAKVVRLEIYKLLYEVYAKKDDYKKAFHFQSNYLQLKDTLFNDNQTRDIAELKGKFESSQKQKEIEKLEKQKVLQELEAVRQKNVRNMLYAGLVVLIISLTFFFNRYRNTKKQKQQVEEQKQLVEEKQKEILDSIHYAKRIQQALLTSEPYIERNLNRLNK